MSPARARAAVLFCCSGSCVGFHDVCLHVACCCCIATCRSSQSVSHLRRCLLDCYLSWDWAARCLALPPPLSHRRLALDSNTRTLLVSTPAVSVSFVVQQDLHHSVLDHSGRRSHPTAGYQNDDMCAWATDHAAECAYGHSGPLTIESKWTRVCLL